MLPALWMEILLPGLERRRVGWGPLPVARRVFVDGAGLLVERDRPPGLRHRGLLRGGADPGLGCPGEVDFLDGDVPLDVPLKACTIKPTTTKETVRREGLG